ncbi:MAG: hypothetical protein HKN75_03520 [Bacteroidia bacterium]|nr:hypothetical protein [Bacteroidia bacterium]
MDKQSEDTPKFYRIRPRFKVESKLSVDELSEKINSALRSEVAPCFGKVKHGYGTLKIPQAQQHYWSPQLSLALEETESGTEIRGLYGPRPSVWTMFVFFYSFLGFAILIISVIGMSNISLDKSGKILLVIPILVLVFLSLYLVSYSGQKLGYKQIETLHEFIETSLGVKI